MALTAFSKWTTIKFVCSTLSSLCVGKIFTYRCFLLNVKNHNSFGQEQLWDQDTRGNAVKSLKENDFQPRNFDLTKCSDKCD